MSIAEFLEEGNLSPTFESGIQEDFISPLQRSRTFLIFVEKRRLLFDAHLYMIVPYPLQ
jgi:hypothetical protein